MSGLSFGQLSKLLCLFDSKSSDFSSWVDLRNDSLSPSIPSSFEFRWSCRFEDARGKLSALRTFRHNFDVEPCRLKNSWKFQRNRIAGRVGNVVPRAFVKPLFRTRSERKNALLFFFFFFPFLTRENTWRSILEEKRKFSFFFFPVPFLPFLPLVRSRWKRRIYHAECVFIDRYGSNERVHAGTSRVKNSRFIKMEKLRVAIIARGKNELEASVRSVRRNETNRLIDQPVNYTSPPTTLNFNVSDVSIYFVHRSLSRSRLHISISWLASSQTLRISSSKFPKIRDLHSLIPNERKSFPSILSYFEWFENFSKNPWFATVGTKGKVERLEVRASDRIPGIGSRLRRWRCSPAASMFSPIRNRLRCPTSPRDGSTSADAAKQRHPSSPFVTLFFVPHPTGSK